MAPCSATTKTGAQCSFKAKPGHTVCGKHMTQPAQPARCGHLKGDGTFCQELRAGGETLCRRHATVVRRRREREAERMTWTAALDALWVEGDPGRMVDVIQADLDDGMITPEAFMRLSERAVEEIGFWNVLHRPPRNVQPKTELHALALDGQNVHTKHVNTQTSEGLEILLGTPVKPDLVSALHRIHWEWCDKPYLPKETKTFRDVMRDMKRWYETPTCRVEDDWLYKRALDGLWVHIKASPHKEDLLQRLWEEAYESLKMCCDGHITRLCNVMVGFDEAFKPPVSVGELLQQRMAAIAEKDIKVEAKVVEAWAVFEELGVPKDQRMAWLDAF